MKPEIKLNGGRSFNFLRPYLVIPSVWEIANSLSKICRFTGQLTYFYSVAQHSVVLSHLVPNAHAFGALMHDSVESVLGDVASPLKQLLHDYKSMEIPAEQEFQAYYGYDVTPEVHRWDKRIVAYEAAAFMPESRKLLGPNLGLHVGVLSWKEPKTWAPKNLYKAWRLWDLGRPWSPSRARREFLARYDELTLERL